MDVSRGMNMGDPAAFRSAVEHLIAALGEKWIKERLAALPGSSTVAPHRDEGSRLLGALAEYPAMLRALEAGQAPRDPYLQLLLGTVAWVVSECSALPGGKRFRRKLRRQGPSRPVGRVLRYPL
jgi:hypothetical protein